MSILSDSYYNWNPPEPDDAAFVAKAKAEIAEAERRCLEMISEISGPPRCMGMAYTRTESSNKSRSRCTKPAVKGKKFCKHHEPDGKLKKQLIQQAHEFHKEHGRRPSAKDAREGLFPTRTHVLVRLFGSWSEFLSVCGWDARQGVHIRQSSYMRK